MRGITTAVAMVGLFAMAGIVPAAHLCEGFLPENDLKISMQLQSFMGGGVTEDEFHEALDRIDEHYTPIIKELGGRLEISRQWKNDTVNASAQRLGSTYRINMYGGLARHPDMDADGFLLVACHEIGHHIGGAPKRGGWFGSWATNEGQADYFAGLRCLREVWTVEENAEWVANNEVDEFLVEQCKENWFFSDGQNLCMRVGTAGMTTTSLFRALRKEDHIPHYSTPDPNVLTRTSHSHPATQCRLDTYFQSGMCVHDMTVPLDDEDVRAGTCTEVDGAIIGLRPRCWYGAELERE